MKKLFILIITLLFITTGCYNYREINDLAIVGAIGIEKENNKYLVTTQIVNIKKTGSENGDNDISKIIVYTGVGKTISEALKDISDKSSKILFYPHIKILILDNEIIINDLDKVLDFLARNPETGLNFYVVTSTTDQPKDILEILTPMDPLPSNDLESLLKQNKYNTATANVLTFEELINYTLKKQINPVYTNIKIEGNKNKNDKTTDLYNSYPNALLKINNLVTFDKKNTLILNKKESIGYNFISNNIKNVSITSKCKDEFNKYFTMEISKSNNNIKLNLKNKEVIYNFNIIGNTGEFNCNKNYENIKTKDDIKNITRKKIESYITSSITKTKKYNNDYIGIQNYIYKSTGKRTYKLKDLKFKINVKLKLLDEGNLKQIINRKDNK